jgi:hypothetical protein
VTVPSVLLRSFVVAGGCDHRSGLPLGWGRSLE